MVNTPDRFPDGAGCVTLSRASTLPGVFHRSPGFRAPDLAPLAGHPPPAFQGCGRSILASGLSARPPRGRGFRAGPSALSSHLAHLPPATLRPPPSSVTSVTRPAVTPQQLAPPRPRRIFPDIPSLMRAPVRNKSPALLSAISGKRAQVNAYLGASGCPGMVRKAVFSPVVRLFSPILQN